ncbi:MAG TPA: hypothetical protein VL947_03975 [Cytophagales bacterium]|nr:hypothetical protein [Cytophagales bacterium]
MMNKKLQILMPICVAVMVNAQDVFKVLAVKGGSTVKTANATEWKKTLVGAKIQQADQIKLNTNDYLGLIHIASGKTLELKSAGTYNAKELSTKVTATGSSYSQKYAEYVMDAMSNGNGGANNTVGGVVYRALEHDVELDYPGNGHQIVINNRVFDITWHRNPDVTVYEVVVQNMFDEVIHKAETTDTTLKVDLTKVNLGDENRIKFKVWPKKAAERQLQSNKEVSLIVDESKDFIKKKEEFLKEMKDETALNHFVRAKFYESENMFIDAIDSYNKAIKLEPKVEEFKVQKQQYLERTGAVKSQEAKK